MKHHKQMAKYDSFKFLNEAFFTVLMIGISAYLATQNIISVCAVLTSYLCFSQLIKPLEELHRILDELSESLILAQDFFKMTEIPHDFSYDQQEPVLKDINLSIEKGSFWGIAGPSGCGKSSLIKAICKLEKM